MDHARLVETQAVDHGHRDQVRATVKAFPPINPPIQEFTTP